jgi:hypothetical protein
VSPSLRALPGILTTLCWSVNVLLTLLIAGRLLYVSARLRGRDARPYAAIAGMMCVHRDGRAPRADGPILQHRVRASLQPRRARVHRRLRAQLRCERAHAIALPAHGARLPRAAPPSSAADRPCGRTVHVPGAHHHARLEPAAAHGHRGRLRVCGRHDRAEIERARYTTSAAPARVGVPDTH